MMRRTGESWLVTGALGCIGAWTVATLVREGASVVGFDLGTDDHRLRLIASADEIDRVALIRGDIGDLESIERVITEHGVTHVVHLAALQTPACKADPPLGSRVNVTGTVNVFEAVKRCRLETTVAYASSVAVYNEHSEIAPKTIYGVYKVANEGSARLYWETDGIASVGLRPVVVYGPGRDQGMTAGPAEAIVAALRGEAYRISFGGRTQLHYGPDVARALIGAARQRPEGAAVFNLGGPDVSVPEVIAAITAEIPSAKIAFDEVPLPYPAQLPEPWFDIDLTPLDQGIRETLDTFARTTVASA